LTELLADSYAFFALWEGNDRYVRIFRQKKVVTTALNVLEVYATLLRRLGPQVATPNARACAALVVQVPSEAAFTAGEFKQKMRAERKDCSYIDAWGYGASRTLGLEFLTGDPTFKGVEGVRFVR